MVNLCQYCSKKLGLTHYITHNNKKYCSKCFHDLRQVELYSLIRNIINKPDYINKEMVICNKSKKKFCDAYSCTTCANLSDIYDGNYCNSHARKLEKIVAATLQEQDPDMRLDYRIQIINFNRNINKKYVDVATQINSKNRLREQEYINDLFSQSSPNTSFW